MNETATDLSRWQLFLDWWRDQLKAWLPTSRKGSDAAGRRWPRVSVSADRYWPAGSSAHEGRPLTSAPASGKVALVLGAEHGFRRQVHLPINLHRSTRQVLAHDLDRLTPLRPADLYFDTAVVERDWAKGHCVVELIAAPRNRVRQQLEAVEARGLEVVRVVLDEADLARGSNLLPPERLRELEEAARGRWLTWLLLALCAVLAAALIILPIYQARERVIALLAEEGRLRAEAEQASVLQRQVEKQLSEYNFLLQRKHSTPLAVQLLDDLSKRTPDDTWVQTLEIKTNPASKAREVIIQGETGSGGKLMPILAESPLLKDLQPKAAMTRLAPNAERFHVSAELVQAQLPEPIPIAEASSAVIVPVAPAPAAGAPQAAKVEKAVDKPAEKASDKPVSPEKAPEKAAEKTVPAGPGSGGKP